MVMTSHHQRILDDYVNKVAEVARAQQVAVILVGYSMGGIVISQAAEALGTDKISALIPRCFSSQKR